MPDPARVAQARVLEIPVTIQGSKTVEGTEQRELFTESTKTALTFENGAALSLQSRVSPGQSLFLRNEQTGREILCKVLEAPPQGETGYTDLEFTVPDPQFWGVDPEQPEPAAEQPAPAVEKSETHPEPEAAAENTLAMMGAPASTITVPSAPAPVETSPSEESSAPPREEIMPAHAQAPEPPSASLPDAPPDPEHVPEFNPAKFEETLAALLDGDTKRAKRAAAKKEKEAQKAAAQSAAEGETSADALGEAEVVPARPTLEQLLTTGKGAIVVGIAASIVIAVCLGLIWRAVRSPFAYETSQPIAASGPSKQKAPAAAPRPSPKPASIVAGVPAGAAPTKTGNPNGGTAAASRSNNASATPTQSAAKVQQPAAAQVPAVKIAMTPAATSTAVVAAGSSKAVEGSLESTGPRVIVSRNAITVDSGTQENHRKSGQPDSDGNVPARIVSQVQPAFPSWAKSLDVDGVVKLDALIDEKGNVAQTKVLSGPRPLQHAAQQAVGLWIFEPAQSDGKPTATHMVLTVEFQR